MAAPTREIVTQGHDCRSGIKAWKLAGTKMLVTPGYKGTLPPLAEVMAEVRDRQAGVPNSTQTVLFRIGPGRH